MITRFYNLSEIVTPGKVTILYGPRRVGKTILVQNYIASCTKKPTLYTGEDIRIQTVMSSRNIDTLTQFVAGKDHLIIDEAQHIKEIGLGLKMLIDARPDLKIIITGSSSFDLANSLGEPLVGRNKVLKLFPIWQGELLDTYNPYELSERLETFLVFGGYPEVIMMDNPEDKKEYLETLVNSLLLKDILELNRVKSSQVVMNLLKLLAFQMGSLVSNSELATKVGLNQKTVERYLDLLEKSFIIKRISPYSRNLRKEITQKAKYAFYDNGVRNAIITNFNLLDTRNDIGALWENWITMERCKKRSYMRISGELYFWRTHDGQEVDIVEDHSGVVSGYECKWNDSKKPGAPRDWEKVEDRTTFEIIHKQNYSPFILPL